MHYVLDYSEHGLLVLKEVNGMEIGRRILKFKRGHEKGEKIKRK